MKYLVDTDWIAEYLKGRQPTTQILGSLRHEGLAISLITYGEIYEGIYRGRDADRHLLGFRRILHRLQVLPLDRAIMRRFAQIRGELRKQGQLIGDFDTLIAATALEHSLILVTYNISHFRRVPDLKLYGII